MGLPHDTGRLRRSKKARTADETVVRGQARSAVRVFARIAGTYTLIDVCVSLSLYIYIYIEREGEIYTRLHIYTYIVMEVYVCVYTYIHIMTCLPTAVFLIYNPVTFTVPEKGYGKRGTHFK